MSNLLVTFGDEIKAVREHKGDSLIDVVNNYTVLDLETTGLSSAYDDILEIGAIRIRDGEPVETFSSFVYSRQFCEFYEAFSFITELTGITKDMIIDAPKIETVLPSLLSFIGNDIVVGHNVNFDINFVYDASFQYAGSVFPNDFIDTMRLSRRLHPEEKHHRLQDIAERLSIDYTGAHRAVHDCEITLGCYKALSKEVAEKYGNAENFRQLLSSGSHGVKAKDIVSNADQIDENNPIFGKVCVFTGTLSRMQRKEAMQLVADLGGINADSVNKKTNYLILGTTDYSKVKNGKSNKHKKADELKAKGFDINVIPEDVFYELVLSEQ